MADAQLDTDEVPASATATLVETSHGASTRPSVEPAVERGALIGRYVVLSRLGAGAMGVVLAAYDPELDRKVALKLLKLRGGDQGAAKVRLQREAQALAKLNHPNVVGVHDVGVHGGQLFVAMEFVEGRTLKQWIKAVPHPRPWPEVLRVLVAAGRGLAAAHQAGLVHRDFKPENVMLGDDGRVRVMDFGLARAELTVDDEPTTTKLEQLEASHSHQLLNSQLTQTGTLVGTPAYMSPEQFRGEAADAHSDQFSFCVALHEALYGTRPFAARTPPELIAALTNARVVDAPKGTSVPGWLRKRIVRGLSPNPSERFPSMQALLDALAHDPAARRRRWWLAAGMLALVGGAAALLTYTTREHAQQCVGMDAKLAGVWDESRRAEVEAAIAATELSYAPDTWVRVEQRLDAYSSAWVSARTSACEASDRGEQSDELLDLRMACLDRNLDHVRATVDVLAVADETTVGNAVEALANLPRLERCADVEALTAEVPPPEDPQIAARVSALEQRLIEAMAMSATAHYADALAIVEPVVSEAAQLDYAPLEAHAWLRLGDLQDDLGDYEAAEQTLQRAYQAALAQRMLDIAASASASLVYVVGFRQARAKDGQRWALDAEPLAEALGTPEARAKICNNLGSMLLQAGEYERARALHERALASWMETGLLEHPRVSVYLNNLGIAAYEQGDYEQARACYERSLVIEEHALGPDHPRVASALTNLGSVALDQGKLDDARRYHARALDIKQRALGPEHPEVATPLSNLGNAYASAGEYEQARPHYERALAIMEATLGPQHPSVAFPLAGLGAVAFELGEYEQSRDYQTRALEIYEAALGPEHPLVAYPLNGLGAVALARGEYEQARDYQARALQLWEGGLGPEHPSVAHALTGLGEADIGLGEPGLAIVELERALAIRSANPGDTTELAKTRAVLARALWDATVEQGGDRVRARELATLARDAFVRAGSRAARELGAVEAWLRDHPP